MRILTYSLWRLLLLAAVAGVLYLVGLRSWLLGVTAVVVAALVAYLLLPGPRAAAAGQLASHDALRRAQEDGLPEESVRSRRTRRADARSGDVDADAEDLEIDGPRA